jgi:CBS domain-containing protein
MLIREIMSQNPEVCTPDTELYYVARKMQECDVGAIPVVESTDSMKPIGIITDRDIVTRVVARRQEPQDLHAEDCMSTGLLCVTPETDLSDALEKMEDKQVRRLLVVDSSGRLCGVVAQADIARCASKQDTGELVQDISEPGHYGSQGMYH